MQTVESVVGSHLGAPELKLYKVVDAGHATALRRVLKDLSCDDTRINRFPGANPVSLDTSHFNQLKKEPYYACEKTDGVRLLLVCYVIDSLRVVALVDRALTAYVLPLGHVPKAMFQGTLLDGELAWNRVRGTWDYLVFDAVTVSGVPVLNAPLKTRLEAAHRALEKYKMGRKDPVRLIMKSFVACHAIGDLDAHIDSQNKVYDVDGIILTPALAPVVYGRHSGMFKLKFDQRHTVDFLVAPDQQSLMVFDSGTHVVVGTLRPEVRPRPGSIVECARRDSGEWDVVAVRTDKTTANDMLTYNKTLLNMREKLTLDHVKRVFTGF